ncbi:hypothetical protein FRC10_003054 [Ceratobasidium sp. 414]|nr:hypothetical protein FRC10_003054 [Ceratobasidium sp. 414]
MEQLPAHVKEVLLTTGLTNYVTVATTALLVYDCFITLSAEVEHIWSSRWTFGRMSFHFNRVWSVFIIW